MSSSEGARRSADSADGRQALRLAWPALLSALLTLLFSEAWVAAEPSQQARSWEVRELSLHSPARVQLVGGWFVMGSDNTELERAAGLCQGAGGQGCSATQLSAETPAHRVHVRSFEIDRLEVSNADYQRCLRAGRCLPARPGADPAPPRPEQPVVQVTWREARDYCRFMGGDLPSEAQWEYAAHGDSQRTFPWGDALRDDTESKTSATELASYAAAHALDDVTAHPKGKSFFGLLNMAGNVSELVLDRYVAPYSSATHSVDPVQLEQGTERVLRGGSFLSAAPGLRARARASIGENEARPDVGFRCAYALAGARTARPSGT